MMSISTEDYIDTLEEIIGLMPGHVYWKDRNRVLRGCNDEQARSLGLKSRKEIVGLTVFDTIYDFELAKKIDDADLQVIQTGQAILTEEFFLNTLGQQTVWLSNKVPLKNSKGEVVGLLGISFDITDRKRAEQELERINQIQQGFISNSAHDIRTPLFGLCAMSQIMDEQETDAFKKKGLHVIHESAIRLSNYCERMMNFAEYEQYFIPNLEKRIDLHKLIEDIIKLDRPAAFVKNLEFSYVIDPNIPKIILGDDYRLKIILMNLVGNAIKFTHQGFAKITVLLVKKDVDKREIILKFIIEDSGIGIPEDKLDIIYERFAKLSPSNQEKYRGLGLGLTAVKKFVTELEGEIACKSVLNQGSTFSVVLKFRVSLEG